MPNELLYEGKAKAVYAGDNKEEVILFYKDDATAFNGLKKETIDHKGILNNKISTYIFKQLEAKGIKTHYIKTINETQQLCKSVKIIPLEFICRNEVHGSMAKRLGMEIGCDLIKPVLEICYKNDELNDPLINNLHAEALGLISLSELEKCYQLVLKINEELKKIFQELNIKLIDFKIEFGYDKDNNILLADEISPDSCRLRDITTQKQLDKDLFRHDIGDLTSAYTEIVRRIEGK